MEDLLKMFAPSENMGGVSKTPAAADCPDVAPTAPVEYAAMTDASREAHLVAFHARKGVNAACYKNEYEKSHRCRVLVVPRRKKASGYLAFLGTSIDTLEEADSKNFVGDVREIEGAATTDGAQDLHVFIDTNGGKLATAELICKTLLRHNGRITVFVDNRAMSAGTLIALCGHEIRLRRHACLGQIDPQMGAGSFWIPANAVDALAQSDRKFETPWIRDFIQIMAGPAKDATTRVGALCKQIAQARAWTPTFERGVQENLLVNNASGGYGHDRPYDYTDLTAFWVGGDNAPKLSDDWPSSAKLLRKKPPSKYPEDAQALWSSAPTFSSMRYPSDLISSNSSNAAAQLCPPKDLANTTKLNSQSTT